MSFSNFSISPEILRSIHDRGHQQATPIQSGAIPQALAGRDLVATAETGSGKTAAYLIPLIDRLYRRPTGGRSTTGIRAMILSPTRELAAQVAREFGLLARNTRLKAVVIVGGDSMNRQLHDLHNGAQVLVAGHNFGCGSSREHAPWALLGFGFRAVVSTRFADIFRNNALKNGLLPIAISAPAHVRLVELLRQQPDAKLAIDLAGQTVTLPDGTRETFPVDPFAKHCLLQGVDELGFLLQAEPSIAQYEATHIARVRLIMPPFAAQ